MKNIYLTTLSGRNRHLSSVSPARKLILAIGVSIMGGLESGLAQADLEWNSITGSWNMAANWTPNQVPTATPGQLAVIDNAGMANLGTGGVAWDLYVGDSNSGTLNLTGGSILEIWDDLVIGTNSGSQGTLTLNDTSTLELLNSAVTVGHLGQGTLEILDDGRLVTKGNAAVGNRSTGIGNVVLNGESARWIAEGLTLGLDGASDVSILSGSLEAQTTSSNLIMGASSTATSILLVDGSNASAKANGWMVGFDGEAELTIQNGGTVLGGEVRIGRNSGSSGEVFVIGNGSSLVSGGDVTRIFVGVDGDGLLDVRDGGTVSSPQAFFAVGTTGTGTIKATNGSSLSSRTGGSIGIEEGSKGDVILDGSSWTTANDNGAIIVGSAGTGSLTLTNQSTLEGGLVLRLGDRATGKGTMTLDNSTWTSTGAGIEVGGAGKGSLTLNNKSSLNFDGFVVTIGLQSSSEGIVSLNDSTWTSTSSSILPFNVGSRGTGTMILENGSTMTMNNSINVGNHSTGEGTVRVDTGSQLTTARATVGIEGQGILQVLNDSIINAQSGVVIGDAIGSTGDLSVAESSVMIVNGLMTVGKAGQGFAGVSTGSSVVASGITVGELEVGKGDLVVAGTGTNISNSGVFTIGQAGTGNVLVLLGAQVSTEGTVIGAEAGSTGSLDINGALTSFTHSNNANTSMIVGQSGSGTVQMGLGGTLSTLGNNGLLLGQATGSSGYVTVSGTDSRVTIGGVTQVGSFGNGTITLSSQASMTTSTIVVGNNASSTSSVEVSGIGTSLAVTGNQTSKVGTLGSGTLSVLAGGKFENIGASEFWFAEGTDSTATLQINGSGSKFTTTNIARIGYRGTATVDISNGGKFEAANPYVGFIDGSDATVNVSGAGSEFIATIRHRIGHGGVGEVNVSNNALLKGPVSLGTSGGSGTLNLNGTTWDGVQGTSGSDIGVTNSIGLVNIFNGGNAQVGPLTIGVSQLSNGTLNVSQSGSSLTSNNTIYIGESGTGKMNVSQGGQVRSLQGILGRQSQGDGLVEVGLDSSWITTGTHFLNHRMIIGQGGDATLDIKESGFVGVASSALVGGNLFSTSGGTGTVNVDGSFTTGTPSTWSVAQGVIFANNAFSNGTVNLINNGRLVTSGVSKADSLGTAKLAFDGGELWLNGDQSNLFGNFSANEVQILGGGGTINTQGFEVASSADISGVGGVKKTGGGRLRLTGTSDYEGATDITSGTLFIDGNGSINGTSAINIQGAELQYSSSVNYSGSAVNFESGTLSGTNWQGNISGLTISAGLRIAPGNSSDTAVGVDQTWASLGLYEWEINDAEGVAGSSWDLVSLSGSLSLSSTSLESFVIKVTSLEMNDSPGDTLNFDEGSDYLWQIATAGDTIAAFDPSIFFVDTSNFTNAHLGTWSVGRGDLFGEGDNELYISYAAIPEPGSLLLFVTWLAGVLCHRSRKPR